MFKELKPLIEKEDLKKNFRFIPEEELTQEDLGWADALVGFNLKADYNYSNVKWVHSLGAGVDRFLYKKKWNEDVLLTRTVCSFGQRIAEYCLSYILRDIQLHVPFEKSMNIRKWQPATPKLLSEQKVMVYGTGEIGQMIARILTRFDTEVYGVSLSGKPKDGFKKILKVDSHVSYLEDIDYIINTLPLTEQTENLFDKKIFKHLTNAGFINVGRGASLNEQALLHALDANQVRFAVLDVFSEEPLQEDHPFWSHPKVHITPHISAVTTPEEGVACFIETLKNLEANTILHNRVDTKKGY